RRSRPARLPLRAVRRRRSALRHGAQREGAVGPLRGRRRRARRRRRCGPIVQDEDAADRPQSEDDRRRRADAVARLADVSARDAARRRRDDGRRRDARQGDVPPLGAPEARRRADGRARRRGGAVREDAHPRQARGRDSQRRQRRPVARRAMGRVALTRFLALLVVALVATGRATAQRDEPGSPRATASVTFLQINDVYQTVPVDGLGGLARVATIKRQMAAAGRPAILVLAGDFLSPAGASSVFKGQQMVDVLNAAGLDMATLGNHEFDFGDDLLIERMRQAKWQWIVSNVIDRRTGRPIGGAAPYATRTFGTLKVGF